MSVPKKFTIEIEDADIAFDVCIEFTYSYTEGRYSGPPCQCYEAEESYDYEIHEITAWDVDGNETEWDESGDPDDFLGEHAGAVHDHISEWLNDNAGDCASDYYEGERA